VYESQLAEHGGAGGVRDAGALESALARPVNGWNNGEHDLCNLAASYAFGIARSHPFFDGNKRTALVVSLLFLGRNGLFLDIPRENGIAAFLALAAGEMREEELADWFRQHLVSPPA
jgi:death-on-curing protein